jgi:hypothetical protein
MIGRTYKTLPTQTPSYFNILNFSYNTRLQFYFCSCFCFCFCSSFALILYNFSMKEIIICGFYPFFSFKGIYHESISFKILFNLLGYFIGFVYYPLIVFLFIIKFIYVEIKTNHHNMFLMSYFIIVITRFVDRSLPRAGFFFQCKKRMLV